MSSRLKTSSLISGSTDDPRGLRSKASSAYSALQVKSQLSPPQRASITVTARSRRSLSDVSSEAAREMEGWAEDMDVDEMSDEANDLEDQQEVEEQADEEDDDNESQLSSVMDFSDEEAPFDHESTIPRAADHEGAVDSLTSSRSVLTDLSDASSSPSAGSSKATTPAVDELGTIPNDTSTPTHPTKYQTSSYSHGFERLAFNIRPKSSIPTNLTPRQYANECILAAESSRLNPYALHPDEYHLFRHHISHTQVTTYLNIRNGILRLWIRQPWAGVTRQAAIGCAHARWFDAASVCYDWLVRHGYINFGCAKLEGSSNGTSDGPVTKKRKTVAVIGAGISGLGCARQLEGLFQQYADRFRERGEESPRVVILEGRSRVGGRVYSREFKTKQASPGFAGKRHTAEMGGMIITGFERGNPINILVRGQLGLSYHALTADTTIYDSGGKPVDAFRDELVEKLYNDCLDRVSEHKHKTQPSKLIEGNRDLLDEGRDSLADGSKTIMQAEEATAALPDAPSVSQQSVPERVNMVPVSSDKLTGRVHTQPGVPATLKASDKARVMGWKVKSGSPETDNIDLSQAIASDGSTLGSVLDHTISQYKHLVDLTAQDHRLINWHIANLEYSNATNLHNLSLRLWDIDAGNEWEGPHTMVVGGYQSVARGLLECPEPLEIKTRFPVKGITYKTDSSGPASVECEDGTVVEADHVICTMPLGVLKQKNIAFDPPLPSWKTDVVDRLGFGILNKVILVYDKVFWNPDRHIFGVLRDATNRHSTSQRDYGTNRGRFFQWFNVSNTTGLPCLIALMAGDAGFDTEGTSNDVLVSEATDVLRNVFGNDVPHPVEAVVTRWGSDRFARGSYSSAAPGMRPDDYDVMARSIGNLFFAGEHTIGTHPATVHGAYLSGIRAASEVLDKMLGPIDVPTPLVLPKDSLLLHKRKQSALDPRQARIEAYELEIWDHIRSVIGERPAQPNKVAGNAYLLFSKVKFDDAKRICEEKNRKPGRSRSQPNEVRVMCSKMWRDATPEERKPYEDQAAANKRAYAEAMEVFGVALEKWDQDAVGLRASYEKEHPMALPGEAELAAEMKAAQKHRRSRIVSYAEDRYTDRE